MGSSSVGAFGDLIRGFFVLALGINQFGFCGSRSGGPNSSQNILAV